MAWRNLAIRATLAAIIVMFTCLPAVGATAANPAVQRRSSTLNSAADELAIDSALAFLATKQLAGGGIEGFTPGVADEFTSVKAVLAVVAASRPVSYLSNAGNTPIDYLSTRVVGYTYQSGTPLLFPGRAGMLLTAVIAADEDPHAFGVPTAMDLVAELEATYHADNGEYSTTAQEGFASGAADTVNQLWAILGLAAAQRPIPTKATDFLIARQEADGGWGYGSGGDVDITAMVLQALIASGNVSPEHEKVQQGLDFLRDHQAVTGGWESWGSLSADSTAAAIQALAAAGYVPATASWATTAGRNPHDDLLGLQAVDGSFSGNALGTAHAIPGLAEAALPIFGRAQRAARALTWMRAEQTANGSWSSTFGDEGATCDASLAFAAAGFNPSSVHAVGSSASPIDYMAANASTWTVGTSPDTAGKLAVTVRAAGLDPTSFGGLNLVTVINAYYGNPTVGAYGDATNTWHQSFAILGLAAAGQSIPPEAVTTLKGLQQADGGWKYDLTPGDWNVTAADSTGLAMQALVAAGVALDDPAIVNARSFLGTIQDSGAGWADANSTAYAMQGLLAAGEDLIADWSMNGHSPFDALSAYQKRNGPFVWSWASSWSNPDDNGLATWQAVPALVGVKYPLVPAASLASFADVTTGPDPDRLVTATPSLDLRGGSIDVIVPLGSDQDLNGGVTITYRLDSGSWQPLTPERSAGFFTTSIPGATAGQYDLHVVFADADGLQGTAEKSATVTRPLWLLHAPFVSR